MVLLSLLLLLSLVAFSCIYKENIFSVLQLFRAPLLGMSISLHWLESPPITVVVLISFLLFILQRF